MGGRTNDCLLIIDVHNDFCPGGTLEVPNSDEVAPIINDLGAHYPHRILPRPGIQLGHLSFASSQESVASLDNLAPDYGYAGALARSLCRGHQERRISLRPRYVSMRTY